MKKRVSVKSSGKHLPLEGEDAIARKEGPRALVKSEGSTYVGARSTQVSGTVENKVLNSLL